MLVKGQLQFNVSLHYENLSLGFLAAMLTLFMTSGYLLSVSYPISHSYHWSFPVRHQTNDYILSVVIFMYFSPLNNINTKIHLYSIFILILIFYILITFIVTNYNALHSIKIIIADLIFILSSLIKPFIFQTIDQFIVSILVTI
jgi:hypothetical protein